MRRNLLLGLGLSIPVFLLAADFYSQMGWEKKAFEDGCYSFVEHGSFPWMPVTPAMKAMGALQRKSAVDQIFAKAKAYYASETFKKRWEADVAEKAKNEADSQAEDAKREKEGMAQMEAMMKTLPKEQQEDIKKAMAMAKQYEGKKPAKESSVVKDPKVALRKSLQYLLKQSEGVDFSAGLRTENGKKYFVKSEYESKPSHWKSFFRAGREATEAARANAKAWLAELN